jgi:uncharacterized membrane protein
MALARLAIFRQGFDLVSYVQPIWNTAQGRPFEQSIYAGTSTILGVDLFLIEGLLALPYALWPSYGLLFGLLSALTALGGLAVYLIARDVALGRLAALLAAVLYLSHLTLQSVTPNEFRPRLIAATALLFAGWLQQRDRRWLSWLALTIALSVRLDVALAVIGVGLIGLFQRRHWALGLAPVVVGLAYWLLGLLVIVPALRQGQGFLFLFYFAWLGETPGEIVRTLLTRPDFVLAGVLTPAKLLYTLHLLWPVAGLALLRPSLLLPALPAYAINMLGSERTQFDITRDYAVLLAPWVVVAAVLAVADLVHGRTWLGRRLAGLVGRRLASSAGRRHALAITLLGLMLVATLSQHLVLGSPVLQYLRGYPAYPRQAGAQALLAQLPAEAPVAVTNLLAAHVPLRRQLYFFPGNRAYPPELVERADYIIGDRRPRDGDRLDEAGALDRLLASGRWRLVLQADDYQLLERRP